MKKFFVFLAMTIVSLMAYAQECATIQEGYTGNALIRFVRYEHNILPGRFAVSATDTVRFSQGNLQYRASTGKWRFAENQWDVIGNAAGNTTEEASRAAQDSWIDLFGWGCSGWNGTGSGTACYPYSISTTTSQYYSGNVDGTEAEWAYHNVIINGGDATGPAVHQWRVLTKAEWDYLFSTRDNATSLSGLGELMGNPGAFLLPDDWDWDAVDPSATLRTEADFTWVDMNTAKVFTNNVISSDEDGQNLWNRMEQNGAVFLPTGGIRKGTAVESVATIGYYWSTTQATATNAYVVRISTSFKPSHSVNKSYGYLVRPVQAFTTE